EGSVVASVVVDDPDALVDVVADHRPQLGLGVATVGTGGDEGDDVVLGDETVELVQDRGQHEVPGLRARAVADRDRHRAAAADDVTQRWSGDRLPKRRDDRCTRVLCRLWMRRRDHGRPLVRELDRKPPGAVRELDPHVSLRRSTMRCALPADRSIRSGSSTLTLTVTPIESLIM